MPNRRLDAYYQKDDFLDFIDRIPLHSPKEMFDLLTKKGYKGQDASRRTVTLFAYRHIRRVRQVYLEGVKRAQLPGKGNSLLVGPTGCGKTFMIELLFREILKIPTAIIDVTGFSETGYVGRDPITILTSLIYSAGGDQKKAAIGIVALDEFDKLATTQNSAMFDGQGTTKDVAGYGVQKELLKLLSPSVVDVPLEYNNTTYSPHIRMSTEDISFIACGAFSGFKGIAHRHGTQTRIGFTSRPEKFDPGSKISYRLGEEEVNEIQNFFTYGFLPELTARFTRIVSLEPLETTTLKEILEDNIIRRFITEFKNEGLNLKVHEDVLDLIVQRAIKRQTGARGLETEFTRVVENVAFEHFGNSQGDIHIQTKNQEITTTLR